MKNNPQVTEPKFKKFFEENRPLKYKEKTIYIKSTVSTINFFLSEEERVELMEVGRSGVINYLEDSANVNKIVRRNSI